MAIPEALFSNNQDFKSIKDLPAGQLEHTQTILQVDNQKMMAEQYNDEKIAGIVAYHYGKTKMADLLMTKFWTGSKTNVTGMI